MISNTTKIATTIAIVGIIVTGVTLTLMYSKKSESTDNPLHTYPAPSQTAPIPYNDDPPAKPVSPPKQPVVLVHAPATKPAHKRKTPSRTSNAMNNLAFPVKIHHPGIIFPIPKGYQYVLYDNVRCPIEKKRNSNDYYYFYKGYYYPIKYY